MPGGCLMSRAPAPPAASHGKGRLKAFSASVLAIILTRARAERGGGG